MKYGTISFIILIICWKIAGVFTPAIILPAPETVLIALWHDILYENLLSTLLLTAFRVFLGFLFGMLVGGILGFVAGMKDQVYKFTKPYITMMQSIPRLSWILIATFWFGLSPSVVIFLVTITVVPFFYVNVSESVRYTDKQMLEVAIIYEMKPVYRFTDIYLPAAMEAIMTASATALSVSWKAVIMAELLSVPTGIGARMSVAQSNIDMASILAYTILIALAAWGSNAFLSSIFDQYLKRWKG